MRIIGYIDHPNMKITVFKMDNRVSIKFETGGYEQTFKFRTGDGLETLEDVKRLVDPIFMEQVLAHFIEMNRVKTQAFNRFIPASSEDEFEQII